MYWNRRAYRKGWSCAAANIGIIYQDQQNLTKALAWFERAVMLGHVDANLEIAKIYLYAKNDRRKAIHYLRQTLKGKVLYDVTEASTEEAQRLLKSLGRQR